MNRTIVFILSLFLFFGFISCKTVSKGELEPASKVPVYSVLVEDATEAAILEQELKLSIVQLEGHRLYYRDEKGAMAARLSELGYGQANVEDLYQVNKAYRQLPLKNVKDSLSVLASKIMELKILIVNREKDHWVVYGSLGDLQKLRNNGYPLAKLNYELRPREVKIELGSVEEVQKISELGVDIFNTQSGKTKRQVIVEGAAYDYQIEAIRKLGYTVTIVKSKI